MPFPSREGALTKVIVGVAVVVLATALIQSVAIWADVQVHTAKMEQHCRRITRAENQLQQVADDLSDIKADIREIKAVLERDGTVAGATK